MTKKSSGHFAPVKSSSENHNQRLEAERDYFLENDNSIPQNVAIFNESIADRLQEIKALYTESTGQKWQDKMTPIKECVFNLDMVSFEDEKGQFSVQACIDRFTKLNQTLEAEYGITAFQTYIHFDEGKKMDDGSITPLEQRNLHAHVLYDFQLKQTRMTYKKDKAGKSNPVERKAGKMANLNPYELSKIQTIIAQALNLERGQEWSKAERLEHGEYREEMQKLDKKKNDLKLEIQQLGEELAEKKSSIESWISTKNQILNGLIAKFYLSLKRTQILTDQCQKLHLKYPNSQKLQQENQELNIKMRASEQQFKILKIQLENLNNRFPKYQHFKKMNPELNLKIQDLQKKLSDLKETSMKNQLISTTLLNPLMAQKLALTQKLVGLETKKLDLMMSLSDWTKKLEDLKMNLTI